MHPFYHNTGIGRGSEENPPLITEHLRDLDQELELLKRKRDMIEKQQSLLNQQQAFNIKSFTFDQPQSFNPHYDGRPRFSSHASSSNPDYSSSGREFTRQYHEQQSQDSFPRQSATKRFGDKVWSDPPVKRPFDGPANKFAGPSNKFAGPTNRFAGPTNKFAGPSNKFASGPPNKFGSGPNPKQSNFVAPGQAFDKTQPGTPTPSERFRAARRPKPGDFKPNKVAKKPKTKNVAKDQGTKPILLADRTPTPQTAGRLELALGNILKVIKHKYSKDPLCDQFFLQYGAGKAMKKEIRERIYKAMVGKPVGHVLEIVKQYRKVYPEDTDIEIVEIGMKKKPVSEMKFHMVSDHSTVNPYIFFKRNFSRLLTHSIGKIFDKIVTLSEEEALRIEKRTTESKTATSDEVKAPTEEIKTEGSGSHDPETPTEDNVPNKPQEQEVTKTNGGIVDEKNKSGLDVSQEHKGGEDVSQEHKGGVDVSQEHKGGVDVSQEHKSEVDVSQEHKGGVDVSQEHKGGEDVSQEYKGGEDVSQGHDGENFDESMEEDANADYDSEKTEDSKSALSHHNTKFPIAAVRDQYEQMINEMLPKKLAFWLPKLKWQVLRALQADLEFDTVRKQIVDETVALINKAQNPQTKDVDTPPCDAKKPDADVKKLKYYVKLQGHPMLPNKKLMKPFLDQFRPQVVKRIKSVRNILFVGFDNKDDFDRIVAANGTVVGTDKILVKISTFMTRDDTPNTSTVSDGDNMNDADDTTELNTSLFNQIDDLLTSIRNEEAENQEDGENANENGNGDNGEGNANVDGKRDNGVGANQDYPNVDETAQNSEDNGNKNENVENREENVNVHETAQNKSDTSNVAENVKNIDDVDKEAKKSTEKEASSNETKVQESTENNEKIEIEAKPTENSDQNIESNARSTESCDQNIETEAKSTEGSVQNIEAEAKSTENRNQNIDNETISTENSDQNIKSEAKVEELKSGAKETVRATPARASTRRGANTPTTPSNVRTRRASRLAQN